MVIHAQDSTHFSSLSNRVGNTEATRLMGKEKFLLEGSMKLSRNRLNLPFGYISSGRLIAAPDLQLSYGINSMFEVSLSHKSDRFQGNNFLHDDQNYVSDWGIQFKYTLSTQKGIIPQTALVFSEHMFSFEGYSSKFYSMAGIAWAYDISQRIKISGDLIVQIGARVENDIQANFKLNYALNDKMGLYTELEIIRFIDYLPNIELGMWYQPSKRWLVNANVGFQSELDDFSDFGNKRLTGTIGAAFVLNNPNKMKKKKRKK